MPAFALAGRHILVTRPLQQADHLIGLLQAQGALVSHQPAISIEPTRTIQPSEVVQALQQADIAIFISKNAVDYTFKLIPPSDWPPTVRIACIGKATAKACESVGLTVDFVPEDGYDSEALLALDNFSQPQIKTKKIVIFRGGDGRDHLKDCLQQRQASVTYLDVYQRRPANLILKPAEFAILDSVLVSSAEGLKNLLSIVDQDSARQLRAKPLIVPGQRCYTIARELGIKRVIPADNATDEAMLASLLKTVTATI